MSNYKQQYKKKPVGYSDSSTGRLVRTFKHEERRRVNRADNFDKHRLLPKAQELDELSPEISVKAKLRRWQVERDLIRKIDAQKKKRPAFKVGVVHHKYYSPPVSSKFKVEVVPCHTRGAHKVKHHPSPEKRITRATQKRLEAKQAGTAVTPAKPSTYRQKAKPMKNAKGRSPSKAKKERSSFAPKNYSFKAPAGLEEIPLFGRFAIPDSRVNQKSTERDTNLQNEEEKPWPRPSLSLPTVDITTAQKISISASSNKNSSTESDKRTTSTFGKKTTRSRVIKKKTPPKPRRGRSLSAPENNSFNAPADLGEIPLFGRFVIPKESKVDKPSSEKKIELESVNEDEKPFASLKSIDKTRKTRRSGSSGARSQSNSSIESVVLQVFSEDESPEDLPEEPEERELEFPETEGEVVADVVNANAMDTSTPPRSGTPVPASFSPYIVSSRGKRGAREEQRTKMGMRRSSANDIPTKDTVMQNLNITVEEEERTAQYFKFILDREIVRLTELCEKWQKTMEDPDLSEDSQYQINQAIGQTNLLIRKKFERFRNLVLDCETGKGEQLVQCRDLQGFWDLIYREVKDCESRFNKLDFLRSRGWIEDQIVVATKKVTRKKAAAAKPKMNVKSSAREWILAARKKKSQSEDVDVDDAKRAEPSEIETALRDQKSPDRRRSTPKNTPTSLLKKLQLSATSRKTGSPLVAMKISRMCKTPEVKLDDSVSYVNSDQTPGKGILKQSQDSSGKKSKGRVDFDYVYLEDRSFTEEADDPLQNSIDLGNALAKIDAYGADEMEDDVFTEEAADENETKEALQNSIDLGQALARIDSYEEDDCPDVNYGLMKNVTIRGAEKRLNFEDKSFEEVIDSVDAIGEIPQPLSAPKSESRWTCAIPAVEVIPDTPSRTELGSAKSLANRRSLRRASKAFEASIREPKEETSISSRVLRSRAVKTETPGKINRRNGKSRATEKPNNLSDVSTKENSDPLRGSKNTISEEKDLISENSDCEDVSKLRRSTRRSVKPNADECTACTPKATLPKTPRTGRSRKVSLLGDSLRHSIIPQNSGDLMSFETP